MKYGKLWGICPMRMKAVMVYPKRIVFTYLADILININKLILNSMLEQSTNEKRERLVESPDDKLSQKPKRKNPVWPCFVIFWGITTISTPRLMGIGMLAILAMSGLLIYRWIERKQEKKEKK